MDDDFAYVYSGGALRIVSVEDKSNPIEVGFCEIPRGANDICVVGNYAYFAERDFFWTEIGALRIISVAQKSNPVEAGFYEALGRLEDVCVVGDYAYVATQDKGLLILRIVKPEYRVYLPIVGPLVLR